MKKTQVLSTKPIYAFVLSVAESPQLFTEKFTDDKKSRILRGSTRKLEIKTANKIPIASFAIQVLAVSPAAAPRQKLLKSNIIPDKNEIGNAGANKSTVVQKTRLLKNDFLKLAVKVASFADKERTTAVASAKSEPEVLYDISIPRNTDIPTSEKHASTAPRPRGGDKEFFITSLPVHIM